MNLESDGEPGFDASVPAGPPPVKLDCDTLFRRARQRRASRWRIWLMSCAGLGLAVVAALSLTVDRDVPQAKVDRVADRNDLAAAQSGQVASADDLTRSVGSGADESSAEPFRLVARVRGQLPVFGVDQSSRSITHLGWIRSDQRVPIDWKSLSEDEQKTVREVFDGQRMPAQISL